MTCKIILKKSPPLNTAVIAIAIILIPNFVLGATGTAFDCVLEPLRQIFTGPIAFTASLLAIVVAGATLVFGGEIGEFTKRLFSLILVISLTAFAGQILEELFDVPVNAPGTYDCTENPLL